VSTLDLIAAVSSDLTPTQRRIAEAALAEPTLLAFGTVSDLAAVAPERAHPQRQRPRRGRESDNQ
jgi:hypothetical protein